MASFSGAYNSHNNLNSKNPLISSNKANRDLNVIVTNVHHHLSLPETSITIPLDTQVTSLKEKLQQCYTQDSFASIHLPVFDCPQPIEDSYVNLSMVKTEEYEQIEKIYYKPHNLITIKTMYMKQNNPLHLKNYLP